MTDDFKKDCPHVSQAKLLSLEDFSKISFSKLKCENCDEVEELLICIFCGKAFCSKKKNSHFNEHHKTTPEHCLYLDIKDLSIWCSECKNKEENNGCYIKSEKTDEYINSYKNYKQKQDDESDNEKEVKEEEENKKNMTYDQKYIDDIKEMKSEDDLCQHIKDLTQENFKDTQLFLKLKKYAEKGDYMFDILCISCGEGIKFYHDLKNHKATKEHNIYLNLNEFSILCTDCKQKFSITFIKDKLPLKLKIYIQIIIDHFPLRPKFLTKEEIFQIKYLNFVNKFKAGGYKNIIFMVGAGISTSAGIPDFRSSTGLFKQLQDKYNLSGPEEFFYKTTFLKKPIFFYEFTKLFDLSQTKPTIAHKFMSYMAKKDYIKYVFTQNIDGLEIKAKIPSDKLIFAHGNFLEGHCAKCYKDIDIEKIKDGINKGEVYYCPDCKGPCKPKIVFYGENLPKRFYDCLENIKDVDLIIVMGTSLKVYPFAAIPEYTNDDTDIVVFNMEKVGIYQYYNLSNNDIFIEGKTDENILKFLKDIKQYDDFDKFIKDEYGEELKELVGKEIKLMNVKDLDNANQLEKLGKEIEKMNLNSKKDDDDDDLK